MVGLTVFAYVFGLCLSHPPGRSGETRYKYDVVKGVKPQALQILHKLNQTQFGNQVLFTMFVNTFTRLAILAVAAATAMARPGKLFI